jgi:hypothetical protein
MTKANYEKQVEKDAIEKHDYNTYKASMSKYSRSSTSTEALPAAAELEEAMSLTRFLFCRHQHLQQEWEEAMSMS